jgi:hypothetical protein
MPERMNRLARVVMLRTAAFRILERHGAWRDIKAGPGQTPVFCAQLMGLSLGFRAPRYLMTAAGDKTTYAMKFYGRLPYGLDIWEMNKVLNMEWASDGKIDIVSFRRGSWEEVLLSAAYRLESIESALIRRTDVGVPNTVH